LNPNPTTNSFTDNGVVGNATYLYRVRAVDASGACPSEFSNIDLATTIIFTDDPLVAQSTIIKANHVSQLRLAVNAVRAAAGMGAFSWFEDPLQQGMTTVKAQHITQLRDNLNPALTALGFSELPSDPGIAQGSIIYANHLQAFRNKVK
jgi:hypothetical protein